MRVLFYRIILPAILATLSVLSGMAQTGIPAMRAVISTNYVVITNMVIVTNFVAESTVTNAVLEKPPTQTIMPTRVVSISNSQTNELPSPMQGRGDWIQLNSGEWLKGKLDGLQERSLGFYSDKLKDQTFDWKDIVQLYSPNAYCFYGDKKTATGTMHVTSDTVTVFGTNELSFPREQLQSISPGGQSEIDFWSGKLTFGANVTSGNTRQKELSSTFEIRRRTGANDLRLSCLMNYGEVNGTENVNNDRATLYDDVFLTRRWFVQPLFGEYYRDIFQNIANRGLLGVGTGYYLVLRPDVDWLVVAGPGYQYTDFNTTQPDGRNNNSTAAGFFGTEFEIDLTKRTSLSLLYEGILTGRDAGLFTQHSQATVSIDLTRRLDLDLSFIWDRTKDPQQNSNGTTPQKDDFRVNLSVGIRF